MNVQYSRLLFLSTMVIALCFLSGIAQAETKIGVVNVQKIMSESKAAKSIQSQLDVYRKSFQEEFSKHERELKDEEKSIIDSRSTLSAEEFKNKRQEFEGELLETRKLVQKRQRSLERAASKSLIKLRKTVVEVVAAMAEKGKYDLIITRQNVILAKKEMDVTDEVMTRLNKSLKKVDLNVETNE